MTSTARLQAGDVVHAYIEDLEFTPEGFSFTPSSLIRKGRYDFVPAVGPSRKVEVYDLSSSAGRPRGKARYL